MQTTIYFVRHGEVDNPQDIFYGRMKGFKLSKQGVKQVEQTADFLKKISIDLLYSSPLLRAKQTAQSIQKKLDLPIHYSKLLLEINTSAQGVFWSKLSETGFDYYASETNDITGETLSDLAKRMEKFINQIAKKHNGKNVVAVGHGDPITMVKALHHNLHTSYKDFRSVLGPYVAHGEILETKIEDGKLVFAKTIFTPLGF